MIREFIKSKIIFLVFLVGALPILVSAQLYPGSNEVQLNPENVRMQIVLTQYLGIFVFFVISFLLVLDIQFGGFQVNTLAFVFFPFISIILVSSFRRDSYILQTSFQVLFYLLIINSRSGREWDLVWNVKCIAGTVSIFQLYFLILGGSEYWQDCRIDKCVFVGQKIFVGPFASGNSLSIFSAILAIVVVSILKSKARLLYGIFFTLLSALGGGRNAILALTISMIAYLIKNRILNFILLIATSVVSFLPVLVTFPDEFATYRGYLWSRTRQYILESGGYAPNKTFVEFVSSSLSIVPQGTNAPHNLWLSIWWDGGTLGLILFFPIFILMLAKARNLNTYFLVPVFIFFLIVNSTDPITSFTHFDSFSWLLFILMISMFDRFVGAKSESIRKSVP